MAKKKKGMLAKLLLPLCKAVLSEPKTEKQKIAAARRRRRRNGWM